MRQSSLSTISFLQKLYVRHFSTTTTNPLQSIKNIPLIYRSHALRQAQEEITDYLRSKRAYPSIYAENISKNSGNSISEIISKLNYSPTDFRYTFRSFIKDNPIDEFNFFCESIGIDHLNIEKVLKHKDHFFENDSTVFDAACCLAEFGFPWNKLGKLYAVDVLIFREKPEFLRGRLDRLVSLGFDNQQIVAICLALPRLLKEEEEGVLDCDSHALLDDFKWFFFDFGFPCDKLERLFLEDDLIFRKKLEFLRGTLDRLTSLGFGNQQVVGILLAFPGLLKEESGLDCDHDALLDDLKRVFLDLDLESCMVGNSDVWLEVCEKVKVFYELGVEKGEFGKLIVKAKSILASYPMAVLAEKVEFFSKLGIKKSEVGVLILSNPEILSMKFKNRTTSAKSILKRFGLCKEKLPSSSRKPYTKRISTTTNRSHAIGLCKEKLPSSSRKPYIKRISTTTNRSHAIRHAREELTDYLHSERALPVIYAEKISENSTNSISEIISKLHYSPTNFRDTFRRFIRSNPINEFDFFCESIGIDYQNIVKLLKPKEHFLEDDSIVFGAACCLAEFGFPWDKLGRLYVEENVIFRMKPEFLRERLDWLGSLGFGNQQVVGIFLSFPGLLKEEGGLDCDYDALLDDLKRVFLDLGLESCMVGNSDVWFEVCEKVKFFYELGVERGEFGKLIVKGKSILTCFPMEALGEKVEFFSRLGFEKSKVGDLILSNPEILGIKIEDRVISVSSILEHFGLCKEKLLSVEQEYKHVFGRNKMVNLPSILRAMDLHEWFFHRMMSGYWNLFASYDLSSPDDGLDENYVEGLKSLETATARWQSYYSSKLKFFHSLGFGENGTTFKLLTYARSSPSGLQERFDFLLSKGLEFSKLCKMMRRDPQLINRNIDSLEKKVDFLVEEIGLPLDCVYTLPKYLSFSLENYIKPKYKFHVWLTDQGWCTKNNSLRAILGTSHKAYLSQLSRIHPSAPQLFMEQYGNKEVDG